MAPFQRRRNQNNNNLLIPVISTISTALLLFLALLSYLAPPPLDHRHHQHSSAFNIGLEAQKDDFITRGGFKEEVFRVPIGGGSSSSQGLWISRTAKFYYGCSNASNKFPLAQAVTAPNRYLSIATSGGLNQQRTGGYNGSQLWNIAFAVQAIISSDLIEKYGSTLKNAHDYIQKSQVWFLGSILYLCLMVWNTAFGVLGKPTKLALASMRPAIFYCPNMASGGWGESYLSCQNKVYTNIKGN